MVALPEPDAEILAARDEILNDLKGLIAAPDGVIDHPDEIKPYETDALTAYRQTPLGVVLPETTAEVAAVMKYCHERGVKVVARGAGTSLAGGALPMADAIVIGVSKMIDILVVDYDNRTITLQPGVTNLGVTDIVSPDKFFYAPDPSSQLACTIAGNIGMNSGGAHCLKYGVTSNNLMGVEMVTTTGDIVRLGGKHLDAGGLDLLGLITGSEGTLGMVTEATLRILHAPEGARPILYGFETSAVAGECVDAIISSGIIPVAIEFMDKPAIHATERFAHAGYPLDVEALLIIEVEGSNEEIDTMLGRIQKIAADFKPAYERVAKSAAESLAIWKGRKSAFGAIGRISPDYFCMDGTIPTGKLPEALDRISSICDDYGFEVANIFHAGDGNLHPLILYNANEPGETERAEECGGDILKLCVELGGCLTGEHGVGVEKRDLMVEQFTPAELDLQRRMKRVFDPKYLMNPHKVFPLVDNPGLGGPILSPVQMEAAE